MPEPIFFYDFSSPYAYFAAHRIGEVLPVSPRWQPILYEAADEAGVDRAALLEGIEREDIKARLGHVTEDARQLGITGIPTVWIDGTLYWGNDRLTAAAAALAGSAST